MMIIIITITILMLTISTLFKDNNEGSNIVLFKMLLIGLLYTDLLLLNNILVLYNLEQIDIKFGYFVISLRSLIIQFIIVSLSIYRIFNIINKHKNPVIFISKLYTKIIMRCVDFTYFSFLFEVIYDNFIEFYTIKLTVLPTEELEKLNEDMRLILRQLINITSNLERIKRENRDLRIVLTVSGDLDIEVSDDTKLSSDEVYRLVQRVAIADRSYNTQLAEYYKLVNKDIQHNNGLFSNTFRRHLDSVRNKHDNQFDNG